MRKNPLLFSSPKVGTITPDDKQVQSISEAAVFEILSSQLQEALDRETKKVVSDLTVKIEPKYTENNTYPALTIKKDITKRLSIKGTRVLDDLEATEQEYKLEFQLTPNLSITSGVESDEDTEGFNETVDFEVIFPFGR